MYPPLNDHSSGRLQSLDIIRGIALFGILVFNIQLYTLMFFSPRIVYGLHLDQPETYAPMQFFIHVFIRGQAYTTYSFLFGIGFFLMWQKNKALNRNADAIFRRRMVFLLVIGLIHGLVFWGGDILHKYGLAGFSLLYFNKKPVRVIVRWIAGLIVFAVLFQTGKTIMFPVTHDVVLKGEQEMAQIARFMLETWTHGSAAQVSAVQRLIFIKLWITGVQGGMTSFIHYEIMFLLGLVAGKTKIFYRVADYRQLLRRLVLWLLPLGILLKCVAYLYLFSVRLLPEDYYNDEKLLIELTDYLGVPVLTAAYLASCALLFDGRSCGFWCWVANAGKLGLTNYLMQTLLCMVIFYAYGFGRAGKTTLTASWAYIFGIYALQLLYSSFWVRRYGTGPVERIWRKFTYAKQDLTGQRVS